MGGDIGRPTASQHFKLGDRSSGSALDIVGNRESSRSGWVGQGGETPHRLFL